MIFVSKKAKMAINNLDNKTSATNIFTAGKLATSMFVANTSTVAAFILQVLSTKKQNLL